MDKETKNEIKTIAKDILISLLIIGLILSALYAFSGRWPPLVVVESSSMSHNPQQSEVGIIDAGDIVLVQEVDRDDITTYVEGEPRDYRKYGQYGDVIVFRPDGDRASTPVIHRAVFYLEYDEEQGDVNIPALSDLDYENDWEIDHPDLEPEEVEDGIGLSGTLLLYGYGHRDDTVELYLENIESSGFITKGDNNDYIDQDENYSEINKPVEEDWILGRSRGQLPWFGSLKLAYLGRTEYIPSNTWTNLIISITAILLIPLVLELVSRLYGKNKNGPKEGDGGSRKFEKGEKYSNVQGNQINRNQAYENN